MRKDDQKPQGRGNGGRIGSNNGFMPNSFRSLSSYLRIVSSGASTVASTVRSAASAASAIVDRDSDALCEVLWAGFDKLECEGNLSRQVLLLGYQFGFQVWDVDDPNNVCNIVSRYDGVVSFMQVLPKLTSSKHSQDEYADSRPLLVLCADESFSADGNAQGGSTLPYRGSVKNGHDQLNGGFVPTVVWFYSLKSLSYIKELKFRSAVYSVRCSSRIVAVLQAAQVHCFDAATLQREYNILTNPIATSHLGFGNIGVGPLAVGPRWIAYSGSVVTLPNTRISPQHLTHSASFTAPGMNGSVVVHYAKQSSKQLAAGIVTLGDIGYKKLSRYYSELLPDNNNSQLLGNPGWRDHGTPNGHLPDAESIGMVIIRDVVNKSIISQFKAHESPIASLCFDPSGTILVTASVQGHNFNVYRVMPELSRSSSGPTNGASYVHLYRLQRGFTNAVIQDISFSADSQWVMISSSRGTSHLFAISPSGGPVTIQSAEVCLTANSRGYNHNAASKPAGLGSPILRSQMLNPKNLCAPGPTITLSPVSRIRSGKSGWRNMVTGAAVSASGRMNSYSGAIASAFQNCKRNNLHGDSLLSKYNMLVFSSSGCVIQYVLRLPSEVESLTVASGLATAHESSSDCDSRLLVEPVQKWNICPKQNRREREENVDIYGENGNTDSRKVFPEEAKKEKNDYFDGRTRSKVKKANFSLEERRHMYISEAEIQMHQPWVPLWAKVQISFQSLMIDRSTMDDGNSLNGEYEIEKIPTHVIEARSRDLVPAVDDLRGPKVQTTRVPASDRNSNGGVLDLGSVLSESRKLPRGSRCDPVHLTTDAVVTAGDVDNGNEETAQDGPRMPIGDAKGFVNNGDSPISHTRLETVNNRESSASDTQPELVNNNIHGHKVENQFEDQGDEFD